MKTALHHCFAALAVGAAVFGAAPVAPAASLQDAKTVALKGVGDIRSILVQRGAGDVLLGLDGKFYLQLVDLADLVEPQDDGYAVSHAFDERGMWVSRLRFRSGCGGATFVDKDGQCYSFGLLDPDTPRLPDGKPDTRRTFVRYTREGKLDSMTTILPETPVERPHEPNHRLYIRYSSEFEDVKLLRPGHEPGSLAVVWFGDSCDPKCGTLTFSKEDGKLIRLETGVRTPGGEVFDFSFADDEFVDFENQVIYYGLRRVDLKNGNKRIRIHRWNEDTRWTFDFHGKRLLIQLADKKTLKGKVYTVENDKLVPYIDRELPFPVRCAGDTLYHFDRKNLAVTLWTIKD